jgi:FkbM family methyltransferase
MVPAWVSPSYPPDYLIRHPWFSKLSAAQELASRPLGFVDVGARGGVHDLVMPIAASTAVLGFEPDRDACEEMVRSAAAGTWPWAQVKVLPVALSDQPGPATLYLCSAPTNHSLLPVNTAFATRYGMEKFSQVGAEQLVTQTLDEVLFKELSADAHWGEFVKLDTQGTEYEILLGAKQMLRERTVALFVEVEFCEIYAGQKLFSDVEVLLRGSGFSFFGFHSTHERSRKLLDKARYIGRERLLHADAVFFKDPLPGATASARLNPRQQHILLVCALLFGYFDFALEIAAGCFPDPDERQLIRRVVEDLAYYDPHAARQSAVDLAKRLEAAPELANIAIGRFVDERRAVCNFEDVTQKLR